MGDIDRGRIKEKKIAKIREYIRPADKLGGRGNQGVH